MHRTSSLFDRLARHPAERVSTRLAERINQGVNNEENNSIRSRIDAFAARFNRRCSRRNRRSRRDEEENEKWVREPRHWLDVFALTNRTWQFLSSVIIYSTWTYFTFSENDGRPMPEIARSQPLQSIACYSLLYHSSILLFACLIRDTKKTKGWRNVWLASVLGDLWMMSLSVSAISKLSVMGVRGDCHPQEQNTSFFKGLVKNGATLASQTFGWSRHHEHEEVDIFCWLPKVIYMLCGIYIFSYTFSILFSGLQLQRYWYKVQTPTYHPGHVEEAVPERAQAPTVPSTRPSFSLPRPSTTEQRAAYEGFQPASIFPTPRPQPPSARSSEDLPRYPTPADGPYVIPQGRSSQETTSSFDPELYLVSDGFRPAPELPTYSSRPPSYRSRAPSYSSRPSSLHDV